MVVDSPPGRNSACRSASCSGRRRHHRALGEKASDRAEMLGDVPLEREDADLHPPRRNSSRIAFARSNRIACSAISRDTTRSTSSGRAPALAARFRAWSSM